MPITEYEIDKILDTIATKNVELARKLEPMIYEQGRQLVEERGGVTAGLIPRLTNDPESILGDAVIPENIYFFSWMDSGFEEVKPNVILDTVIKTFVVIDTDAGTLQHQTVGGIQTAH